MTFERHGECLMCGACCHLPISQPWAWMQLERTADPGMRFKMLEHHSLLYQDTCSELQEDGRCGVYTNRPQPCRDAPRNPMDIELLPDCGYWFTRLLEGEVVQTYGKVRA